MSRLDEIHTRHQRRVCMRTRDLDRLLPRAASGRGLALLLALLVCMNVILVVICTVQYSSQGSIHESTSGVAVVGTLRAVLSRGVVRIGLTLDYPPFPMDCADGTAAGSDVDAALGRAHSAIAPLISFFF